MLDLSIYKAKPDKTIREHTDDLLNNLDTLNNLKYIKEEKIYELVKAACEYHDYGKANIEFQIRMISNTKFNEDIEIAHNILSLYFINEMEFKNIDDYYKVSFAVLNHHNYCDNIKIVESREHKELINSLLKGFDTFKITRNKSGKIAEKVYDKDAILVKGYLHKCDFSASGNFQIEHKNEFLSMGLEDLLNTWKKKNVKSKWNNLQLFCKKNKDKNIIVVAETGMGKTEAGLHWIGNNKGIFILPLKTAINSIYKRIKDEILCNKSIETKLALLHSDSLSYYQNDNNNSEMDVIDYHNRSKQLSMPLSISTLDQIFDFVFKYQGYELKLTTLSYSKIVIDEIQMYSADLLAYLIYGLKIINKYGGKIAILTATLAPFIKDFLTSGENAIEFEANTFISDKERHNIKTYDYEINSDAIYNKFVINREKRISNKILVVCNTVKKAQQIYAELAKKNDIVDSNINILHSKFIKQERAIKERELLKFGRTEHIGECIWISTQIVEASLDIDFDYLFTELSDISALFQRLGRCNRKGEKSVCEPNSFIFLEINRNLLTNGDNGFIDKKIYEISKDVLKNIDGILSEQKKVDLINTYLTTENIKGSDYWEKYTDFYRWIKELDPYEIDKRDIKLRNIRSYDVIPIDIYEKNKDEINEYSSKLLNDETNIIEKIKSREEIMKYTVPVGIYDIFSRGVSRIASKIQLSRRIFINVVNCNYSELGFIRLSNIESKSTNENFDNFL